MAKTNKVKSVKKMHDLDKVRIGKMVWIYEPSWEGLGIYVGKRNGKCYSEKTKDYAVIIRMGGNFATKDLKECRKEIVEQELYPDDESKLEETWSGNCREIAKESELHSLYEQMLKGRYDKILYN